MTDLRAVAAGILGISPIQADQLIELRHGARTRTLFATPAGLAHRFGNRAPRVVVKLYKGDGSTTGSHEYLTYHAGHFHQMPALHQSSSIQKSVTADVHTVHGESFPYAVLEYIEGEELADLIEAGSLNLDRAAKLIQQILVDIWIPLWDAGLRFKDCHPGNFIIGPSDRVYMIDTEQMRKDAAELLTAPGDWRQRQTHEESALSRLPGLLSRIKASTQADRSESAVREFIKFGIKFMEINQHFSRLGRGGNRADAELSARALSELIWVT